MQSTRKRRTPVAPCISRRGGRSARLMTLADASKRRKDKGIKEKKNPSLSLGANSPACIIRIPTTCRPKRGSGVREGLTSKCPMRGVLAGATPLLVKNTGLHTAQASITDALEDRVTRQRPPRRTYIGTAAISILHLLPCSLIKGRPSIRRAADRPPAARRAGNGYGCPLVGKQQR